MHARTHTHTHTLNSTQLNSRHEFMTTQHATQNKGHKDRLDRLLRMSTTEQETQNLSDIFDLELCENELLKNNDKKYGIHINHKNNDITKINDDEWVQMYGKNKYGNMKVLNNNTQSILNVILKAQIKQSKDGSIYIGVTESNFNVCKNNDYIEKSEGIYF